MHKIERCRVISLLIPACRDNYASQCPPVGRDIQRPHVADPLDRAGSAAERRPFGEHDLVVQQGASRIGVHQLAVQRHVVAHVLDRIGAVVDVQHDRAAAVDTITKYRVAEVIRLLGIEQIAVVVKETHQWPLEKVLE